MIALKKINKYRRIIMRALTRNIGRSSSDVYPEIHGEVTIKRVLISRPNDRLGNLLLVTPLVLEVASTFPDSKIDLFVRGGLAPTLFMNYKNVEHIFQLPKKPFENIVKYLREWNGLLKNQYDLVINVDKNSSSGRISTQYAHARFKLFGEENRETSLKQTDAEHVAKAPVYYFRNFLTRLGVPVNNKPIPFLDLKLTTAEIAEGEKILKKLVNNDKKSICIFTYATGSKRYPAIWWENFYNRLIMQYPQYNIIEMLPKENVSQISFKAPTFYSNDLRQIAAVFANTKVFIGADSGIMHLASASGVPTVGLFSVTDANRYQPYNNNSVGISTNNTDIEESIKILDKILVE